MELENIATPFATDAPHRRYAALHRAVECGMATDATWRELVDVCVSMGLIDEALSAHRKIENPRLLAEAETVLVRHGILRRPSRASTSTVVEAERASFKDQVADAVQILFEDHMPLTVIVTTTTFPLVVGLVGFLCSRNNSFLFPVLALLPALCVLGLVGALSRRIMVEAARGLEDAPRIPALGELSREAGRFLVDAAALAGIFLAPGFVLAFFGSSGLALLALALGGLLLPMALTIRQLTDDWRALSPNYLFSSITRARGRYLSAAAACALLFLPATVAALLTMGSQAYLQASVVGPLLVAPLFVASRLLGSMVDDTRELLGGLLDLPARVRSDGGVLTLGSRTRTGPQPAAASAAVTAAPPAARQPAARPANPASPPTSRQPARHPAAQPGSQPAAQPAAQPSSRPAAPPVGRPRRRALRATTPPPPPAAPYRQQPMPDVTSETSPQCPPPRHERRAEPKPVPSRRLTAVAGPAPAPVTAQVQTQSQADPDPSRPVQTTRVEVGEEAPPDYTRMPGFNVVKGKARVLAGAAAAHGGNRRRR